MPACERLPPLSTAHPPRAATRWHSADGGTLTDAQALRLLQAGTPEVRGRLVGASNATLYSVVEDAGRWAAAVYKPARGERPLWDFPHGSLAGREAAAYLVSEAAGFDVVPPTVLRDGPAGRGSVQLWVEPAPDDRVPASGPASVQAGETAAGLVDVVRPEEAPAGWLAVLEAFGAEGEPLALVHAPDPRLATVATFDVVVNNADRKAGHLLAAPCGRVVGVDHGLTFHEEPKLRTVLWGFAGARLDDADLARVQRLADWLAGGGRSALAELLAPVEVDALVGRARALLTVPFLPHPDPERAAIPWPPF